MADQGGRTHARDYSVEDLAYLNNYNRLVGLYLWLGLIGMLFVPTVANIVIKIQGHRRRRRAGFNIHSKRPPQMRLDNPEQRRVSVR
jgi:hypothetical protein